MHFLRLSNNQEGIIYKKSGSNLDRHFDKRMTYPYSTLFLKKKQIRCNLAMASVDHQYKYKHTKRAAVNDLFSS